VWRFVALLAATLLAWTGALAQETGSDRADPGAAAVPAYRQANKVVVITIEGGIDAITAMSLRRRIALAEAGAADALVIDIDSPGGEVGAVLEMTNAIKGSSIANTVAWINPDAYSGGAITALACREIVTNSPASMGDAFPVTMTPVAGQNRMGLRGLTPDERTKILPVLLADVTDSARRAGWDEYMVQAIVIDGIELWWVEDTSTGQRLAINEEEFKMLFGRMPVRGKPLLAGVTGGVRTGPQGAADGPAPAEPDTTEAAPTDENPAADDPADAAPGSEDEEASAPENRPQGFLPASEALRDIADEFESPERTDLRLEQRSQRPVLTPGDAGRFIDLGYLTDGSAPIVMRNDQLLAFGFASAVIRDDEELKAYFGADELIRLDQNWSEGMVRFMTGGVVRGVLIVVMLLALFLEMMSPGLTIPGLIAVASLVLLLAPPALIGMAGWWEIAAIVLGILLLGVEIFVLPGFGLFGVLGVVALFGGLLGTFIPAGGAMGNAGMQADLLRGATTIMLAVITAGIGMYLIARHFERVPILDRLVLGARAEDEEEEGARVDAELLRAASRAPRVELAPGDLGVATTALRPSGTAEFDERLIDVVADYELIDAGTPVRVLRVEGFRVVVVAAGPEDTA
jgi:membrane-bound serine protease (ClpP class)